MKSLEKIGKEAIERYLTKEYNTPFKNNEAYYIYPRLLYSEKQGTDADLIFFVSFTAKSIYNEEETNTYFRLIQLYIFDVDKFDNESVEELDEIDWEDLVKIGETDVPNKTVPKNDTLSALIEAQEKDCSFSKVYAKGHRFSAYLEDEIEDRKTIRRY